MLTTVLELIRQVGPSQIAGIFVALLLTPWIILVIVSIAQHRRFEAVVKMYENNFAQTESVNALNEGYRDLAKGYRELVQWTTVEVTETKESVINNMHCPIVRKHAKPKDLSHE